MHKIENKREIRIFLHIVKHVKHLDFVDKFKIRVNIKILTLYSQLDI